MRSVHDGIVFHLGFLEYLSKKIKMVRNSSHCSIRLMQWCCGLSVTISERCHRLHFYIISIALAYKPEPETVGVAGSQQSLSLLLERISCRVALPVLTRRRAQEAAHQDVQRSSQRSSVRREHSAAWLCNRNIASFETSFAML